MEARRRPLGDAPRALEEVWREALERCCSLLEREGFTVSWIGGSAKPGTRPADLLGANANRLVRVIVLLPGEVDTAETRARIRASLRKGETRVCVPWPLRWRLLSNLDRWGLPGAAVAGW